MIGEGPDYLEPGTLAAIFAALEGEVTPSQNTENMDAKSFANMMRREIHAKGKRGDSTSD